MGEQTITFRNLKTDTRRMSSAEIRTQARLLYLCDTPFALVSWIDEVRAMRIGCDSVSVIQMVHAYSNLIRDEGPRQVDLAAAYKS